MFFYMTKNTNKTTLVLSKTHFQITTILYNSSIEEYKKGQQQLHISVFDVDYNNVNHNNKINQITAKLTYLREGYIKTYTISKKDLHTFCPMPAQFREYSYS